MDKIHEKYEQLQHALKEYKAVLVAYSGGVDSRLLALAANEALGEKAIAVTISSSLNPLGEIEMARDVARQFHWRHRILELDALAIPEVIDNSPERCYYCKHALFSKLIDIAQQEDIHIIVDGSNMDDHGERRPGVRALREIGIRSPLQEVSLTKKEIRELSRVKGLPSWDLPAQACLATRFPYGVKLSADLVKKVGQAELDLRQLGFEHIRLRHHGNIARVELGTMSLDQLKPVQKQMVEKLKGYGYVYICLDLEGYRFGSMDEAIT